MEINIPTATELRERLNSAENIAVQEQFKEVQLKLNLAVKNNSPKIYTGDLHKQVIEKLKSLGYKITDVTNWKNGWLQSYSIEW